MAITCTPPCEPNEAEPVPGIQQPCVACPDGAGAGGGSDVENILLCDVGPNGEILGSAIAVYEYDADGNPVGPPTFADPATGEPYVQQGIMQPCPAGSVSEFILCDVQADNSSVQFIRKFIQGPAGDVIDTVDLGLDGAPYAPTGTVASCEPYRLCTPLSEQDLNGDCGPGEVADIDIIGAEGVSADSVITDDATADALCGGVWDRPSEASPFTVNETFRNATYDLPGPVVQGSPPYAGLTASPSWTGSNVDAPGQGWLQTSDINSFTNGVWQVPTPFSVADGMTARVTFASHDGTGSPNGDGFAFVFTDGGIAPQSTAVGGGGHLGLANWDGGYLSVVLDEYGGTGAGANTISIQGSGPSASGVIISQDVAPHNISNDTGRANPGQLIISIIEEAGQVYVSASVLWSGDTDPTVYFNRHNVTADVGPAPSTLRMAIYGGSGGAFRSEHEFRDALATAAGKQEWRAFPITTDPIPACVTSVLVSVCVDVTFVEDTQPVGNGNPEAFLWLVNSATNTVLDRAQRSSQPTQTGTVNNICVDATVPVAQLPDLRVYVGAETRDTTGIYGSSWENLTINVSGLGCPVPAVRTIAISAPCPIDVRVIGGSSDGTPAPVTVVNTPSTFEDALVCATIGGVSQAAFRRELRASDGTVTNSFLGVDGLAIVPDSWTPGACSSEEIDQYDTAPHPICYQSGPTTETWYTYERVLFNNTAPGTEVSRTRHWTNGTTDQTVAPAGVVVACTGIEVLATAEPGCANGVPFTRMRFVYTDSSGQQIAAVTGYWDSAGVETPVAPVGFTLGDCPAAATTGIYDREIVTLCDDNGPFLRHFFHTQADATSPSVNSIDETDLEGVAYVPVGAVRSCAAVSDVAYTSEIVTLDDSPAFNIPVSDGSGGLLHSWSVRHRSGVVIVTVGGVDTELDPGEIIDFDAGDDPKGFLSDDPLIDATAGSARITLQYRSA